MLHAAQSDIPQTARAAVITGYGQPLSIRTDYPVAQPESLQPNQCLVRLEYTGVCSSDLNMKEGGFGADPTELPRVGGHEGVGRVVAIGGNTTSNVKIGDRVGVKWIATSCLRCNFCLQGAESSCPETNAHIHGKTVHGAFADYVVAYSDYVTPIPEGLSSAEAAPILCAGVTVYKAIKSSGATVGQWILISGAGGGLGHLGVQYASAMGLRVIAVDTGDDKRDFCLSLGAEAFVDFRKSEDVPAEVKRVTSDGLGVTAAVVAAGDPRAYEQALWCLRPTGTLVCAGLPPGASTLSFVIPYLIVFVHRSSPSFTRNRQDVIEALDLAARGKVKTRLEIRDFGEVNRALEDLRSGKVTGRIVLKIS
ncbi:putative ADH1-alcohol dehydrogenase I [Fistulina hepatica ATCC 64428]|uniref:alcohol dehydrogenase n=1 Tax=Fistulina hepatica ATCC 64428 TaxID=1128425 RepID=A0A0D7AC29_9AGAR|nr:putative ADH1-alcohol dehydrogenase I [Fistulina hepatica ATCC 64428]